VYHNLFGLIWLTTIAPLFLDSNGLLRRASSACDGGNIELTLSILSYLLKLSTNYSIPGGGCLFLLSLLAEFIIPNVTINRIRESVELVELFDWILHEMEESSTKVSQLRNNLDPQVVRFRSN
jgi:hypothetical protein